ncbi:N-acetyltransferase [Burkholderia cenocepacia]|uniref:GNAT family N-acetyltransferase n=1 Tax=Burkholderia cenocepacia TaxID=95486 RepID=UPI000F582E1E|nr:GNAT family protein [Burkholderia cenocepacia]RQU33427.1 N-acetyltransferase [Burkholderia cenocepacia]RQU58578.1 N-acetyltransferase [Burkholderia cenocepacia]
MTTFPTLKTSRLLLREILVADAPSLFSVHGDAEGMRWFGTDPMTNPEEADRLVQVFADWRTNGSGVRWAIERHSDGRFLGTCGLFRWNRSWKSCVIGYELAPFARGNGYMQEALLAAIDYGFGTMQINRVEAQVHPKNVPSIRTLETLGFLREGYQRQAGYWHETYHDLLQFALLRAEFQHYSACRTDQPI